MPPPGRAGKVLTKMAERTAAPRVARSRKQQPIAQLWAHAAHDLRQPVQGALLATRMLEEGSTQLPHKRTARHIAAALESLSEMLEILSLLSRIETGIQLVPLRTCQLSDVLQSTLQEVAEIAAERGIPLTVRSIRGVVRTNPKLLAVAMRSLMLNALSSASGNRVLVCCRRRGGQLRIEVQIRGTSIDGANERKAFIQLPPLVDRQIASQIGLGFFLLKRLCHRLGHTVHFTNLKEEELWAMELPLAPSP